MKVPTVTLSTNTHPLGTGATAVAELSICYAGDGGGKLLLFVCFNEKWR